jgi:hypothetical protein
MARVVIDPAVPDREALNNEIARLRGLDVGDLRARWHTAFGRRAPPHLNSWSFLSANPRDTRIET